MNGKMGWKLKIGSHQKLFISSPVVLAHVLNEHKACAFYTKPVDY
jgi:hypothetical protein